MKSIVLLLSSCILFSVTVFAQEGEATMVTDAPGKLSEAPVKKNVFQFSPFHLLASQFKVGYERYVGKSASSILLLAGVILKESNNDNRTGGTGELHFRISILHKNYPRSSATLFAGPFVKYKYLEIDKQNGNVIINPSSTTVISTGTVGVMVGIGLAVVEKINFNFYFGGGAKYSDTSVSGLYDTILEPAYTGIVPEAGFLFGFKF